MLNTVAEKSLGTIFFVLACILAGMVIVTNL